LFADTPNGAKASATVYSIVETAKANNIDILRYLEYLLQLMPSIDFRRHPEMLEDTLPWSDKVQKICKTR